MDWTVVASLATAAGTLVLAVATFAAVRSANRSARATERALLAGIRPVLMPSKLTDPMEKIGFIDGHWVKVDGGRGVFEATDDAVYLAMSLRNAGNGLAVLDRWDFYVGRQLIVGESSVRDIEQFRRLTRDLYIPAGEVGLWQGAFRDKDDPLFAAAHQAATERTPVTIDVLYGDHEGGQRTISRFSLTPIDGGDAAGWITSVSTHRNLDRDDPR